MGVSVCLFLFILSCKYGLDGHLFIQQVFIEHLLCDTHWGWGVTDVIAALLELIYDFAQETEK